MVWQAFSTLGKWFEFLTCTPSFNRATQSPEGSLAKHKHSRQTADTLMHFAARRGAAHAGWVTLRSPYCDDRRLIREGRWNR